MAGTVANAEGHRRDKTVWENYISTYTNTMYIYLHGEVLCMWSKQIRTSEDRNVAKIMSNDFSNFFSIFAYYTVLEGTDWVFRRGVSKICTNSPWSKKRFPIIDSDKGLTDGKLTLNYIESKSINVRKRFTVFRFIFWSMPIDWPYYPVSGLRMTLSFTYM